MHLIDTCVHLCACIYIYICLHIWDARLVVVVATPALQCAIAFNRTLRLCERLDAKKYMYAPYRYVCALERVFVYIIIYIYIYICKYLHFQ